MKKFKSLMLAALASAALAAPSFAESHGPNVGITSVTGAVEAALDYSSYTIDNDDTVTKQDTGMGVVKINFGSDFYDFFFESDGSTATTERLKVHHTMTSGDNTVAAYGEWNDILSGAATLGSYHITGSNKTFSLKIGKFGSSENYANGMGVVRAAVGPTGQSEASIFADYGKHLVIPGSKGVQADINAGDVKIEIQAPWMHVANGEDATLELEVKGTPGTTVAGGTNVTGIRPKVSLTAGSINIMALAYSLNFAAADGGDNPAEKTSNGFQLMGNVSAGAATIGLGVTNQTRKDGTADSTTPNNLNGYVKVALGGGSSIGASFDMTDDGNEDETTATRMSASYSTPFFVEGVTLSLGVGTASQKTDATGGTAGSASALKAKWAYAF
jgi:hypothetical protein